MKEPKLPRLLLDQIGGDVTDQANGVRGTKSKRFGQHNRKDRRKAERTQKKAQKGSYPRFRPIEQDDAVDGDASSHSEAEIKPVGATRERSVTLSLKERKRRSPSVSDCGRSDSPVTVLPMSRAVKDKMAEDDAEVAALERRLGLKGKTKSSQSLKDDGLDYLLNDLSDDSDASNERRTKRKRGEYDDFLKRKRRRSLEPNVEDVHDLSEEGDTADFADSAGSDSDDAGGSDQTDNDDLDGIANVRDDSDGFEGFSSEKSEDVPPKGRQRENPYVPPVSADAPEVKKYIPPSMRGVSGSDMEAMSRLRRQIQGLLNRLSEANLTTIVRDIDSLYQANPRQQVTLSILDLLIGLLADKTRLNDTFLILHAGFVAALYKVVGVEFGAQFLERLVTELDRSYEVEQDLQQANKIPSNLISIVAMLYTFHIVGSTLVFDYIRTFLQTLSELNTELLLIVVRDCGSQLRQDDPSSLKDIVIKLQTAAHEVGEKNISVRTKFMIETVNNLKNNRAKGGAAASAVVAEHVTRMRKIVGSLNAHTNRASEPLRVGLHDIRNAEKSGKWWLVGASWRGEEVDQSKSAHSKGSEQLDFGGSDDDYESTNLLQLAKEQRMNTEIRRAIFISIMSATDYKDAHLRLLKLHLRKAQELEVPRILLQCAGAEQNYNPYYTFIAKKLCTDRKLKMAFQFSLWDLFKRMGERSFGEDEEQPDSEDEDEALKTHQLVNFGKMYGVLIAGGALNVGILKNLNFAFLRPKTRAFLEVLFTTAILETQKRCKQGHDEQALSGIFEAATSTPQVIPGLRLFFQRLGNAAEFAKSGHEKETVQWGFRVSRDALTRIQADAAKSER